MKKEIAAAFIEKVFSNKTKTNKRRPSKKSKQVHLHKKPTPAQLSQHNLDALIAYRDKVLKQTPA